MTAAPLTSSMKWLIPFSERAKALKEQLNAVFWRGLSEEGLLTEAAE
jgi:hypothetical protein